MSWIEKEKALHRDVKTKDFMTSFRMVEAITPLAEAANHHPDIDIRWRKVRIGSQLPLGSRGERSASNPS